MKWKTIIGVMITMTTLAAYLLVSTGFADTKQQNLLCSEVRITIGGNSTVNAMQAADVEALLAAENIKTIGEPVYHINTYNMMQVLNTRGAIKNASAYTTIDGVLHIKLSLRRPIMRVQTSSAALYIDECGYIFPTCGAHSAYVPVMTGNIPMSIPARFRGMIPENETFLQQAYRLALYLDENPFWQSHIAQIDVAKVDDVRIIPCEGNHVIDMGSLDNYRYKFSKLAAFYAKAYPANDNAYERINLSYGNKVVCKKRK